MATDRPRIAPWVLAILTIGWALVGVVGAAGVALLLWTDDVWCEHETGDSNFGDGSWSWWPLGLECTWTEESNGLSDNEDPSWVPTVFTVAYVAAGAALAWGHGLGAGVRGRPRSEPP